jgi:hypothetical protein
MKTYPGDRYNWYWEENDRDVIATIPPPWSCYCLDAVGADGKGVDDGTMRAAENCINCDGHGFMPIPPGELGLE